MCVPVGSSLVRLYLSMNLLSLSLSCAPMGREKSLKVAGLVRSRVCVYISIGGKEEVHTYEIYQHCTVPKLHTCTKNVCV